MQCSTAKARCSRVEFRGAKARYCGVLLCAVVFCNGSERLGEVRRRWSMVMLSKAKVRRGLCYVAYGNGFAKCSTV